jgi:undecaprenyl-diphosphatase
VRPREQPLSRTSDRVATLGAAAGSLSLFSVLAATAARGERFRWDGSVARGIDWIAPVSSTEVHIDPYLQAITVAVAVATAALGLALLARRDFRPAAFLFTTLAGTVILNTTVKLLVQRPPIEGPQDEYSFPSGSAAWSMATLAALFLLAPSPRVRRVVVLAGTPVVLVYGGVITFEQWHYPSDVLAAWCLGLGWAGVLWFGPFRRPRAASMSLAWRPSR